MLLKARLASVGEEVALTPRELALPMGTLALETLGVLYRGKGISRSYELSRQAEIILWLNEETIKLKKKQDGAASDSGDEAALKRYAEMGRCLYKKGTVTVMTVHSLDGELYGIGHT